MFSPCSRLTDLYQSRLVRKSPAGDWCQRFRPTNLHYSKALWPLIVLSLRLWLGLLPAAGNVGRLARTHPAMHAEQPARKACQHPSPLDITRQLHWTDLNVRAAWWAPKASDGTLLALADDAVPNKHFAARLIDARPDDGRTALPVRRSHQPSLIPKASWPLRSAATADRLSSALSGPLRRRSRRRGPNTRQRSDQWPSRPMVKWCA